MAQITQPVPTGLWGKLYGSFVGKSASTPGTAPITQPVPTGLWGRRYGNFGGKAASAVGVQSYQPLFRPRRR